jgi:hypothetical protein
LSNGFQSGQIAGPPDLHPTFERDPNRHVDALPIASGQATNGMRRTGHFRRKRIDAIVKICRLSGISKVVNIEQLESYVCAIL